MLDTGYVKIKDTTFASTSSQWLEENRQENRISVQGYDALNRGVHIEGVHVNVTMSPSRDKEGERNPRELRVTPSHR